MYLQKVTITNIRAISSFEMDFTDRAAGWHVIIGENGAGKSSVIRALSVALLGPKDFPGLREDLDKWIYRKKKKGGILIIIEQNIQYDKDNDEQYVQNGNVAGKKIGAVIAFRVNGIDWKGKPTEGQVFNPKHYFWGNNAGWFSCGFGPFRRFSGNHSLLADLYKANPKLAPHLSVFGEDIALANTAEWLKNLRFKELEHADPLLSYLMTFINQSQLLPDGTKIQEVNSEGVWFKDGNGNECIDINDLSEGYRSVLSIALELIRQLVQTYGAEQVFQSAHAHNQTVINLPGVVLIDEIDAHLHPSWQTRIGTWFTTHFPQIQFIVTSHSPLVCRAAQKGTIWRLAAPNSEETSGEVTVVERDRLLYGNILDAFGTELFGQEVVVRTEQAETKRKRLGSLNIKFVLGKINEEEEKERLHLQKIFMTDASTGF